MRMVRTAVATVHAAGCCWLEPTIHGVVCPA